MPTDDVRLDDNSITDVDVIDTVTQIVDYPGELVTERDRHRLAGERVLSVCSRSKERPLEVLVQVGPADAAPLDLDRPRTRLRLRNVVDADVARTIETCSFHEERSPLGSSALPCVCDSEHIRRVQCDKGCTFASPKFA